MQIDIPASKSLMNRALIVKSFFSNFEIRGLASSKDVDYMEQALKKIKFIEESKLKARIENTIEDKITEFYCGDAGTTLRFLALRVSRISGTFYLSGSERLFSRPQQELVDLLQQLGVQAVLERDKSRLKIISNGWCENVLSVNREKSSQFASALLLSTWNLPFDLNFTLNPTNKEDSYFQMTLEFLKQLGFFIQSEDVHSGKFKILSNQIVNSFSVQIEPDYSSMFSVAAVFASSAGSEITFNNIPNINLQPDFKFVEILKQMNVNIKFDETLSSCRLLTVYGCSELKAIQCNLEQTPDLFPVLSVLCAFSNGVSKLYGAPRLAYKESNRILKAAELLKLMRVNVEILNDGLVIYGCGNKLQPSEFTFDPDHDHRMAMAVGILLHRGWPVHLCNPMVVEKSYPDFWKMIGLGEIKK